MEKAEERLPSLRGLSLLVLDDDPNVVRSLVRVLGGLGADVAGARSVREARLALEETSPDAVLADLRLKDGTGLELLPDYLGHNPDGRFYVITGHGSIDNAVEALRQGARHYFEKPVDPLILNVFPGESGATRVYEDEGDTDDYRTGSFAFTPVEFERKDGRLRLVVGPVEGDYPGMPGARAYELRLVLTHPPEEVRINGESARYGSGAEPGTWDYDGDELTTRIRTPVFDVRERTVVEIRSAAASGDGRLSGGKGAFRRLKRFMKFLARNNWDKSVYSNDTVVRAAQTGHRIGLDPSRAGEEMRRFEEDRRETMQMVYEISRERPEFRPYVDLFRASGF